MQSSTTGHPFPPPGRRQGPSVLVPGQNIRCLTLAVVQTLTRIKGGDFSSSVSGRLLMAFLCLSSNYTDSLFWVALS